VFWLWITLAALGGLVVGALGGAGALAVVLVGSLRR